MQVTAATVYVAPGGHWACGILESPQQIWSDLENFLFSWKGKLRLRGQTGAAWSEAGRADRQTQVAQVPQPCSLPTSQGTLAEWAQQSPLQVRKPRFPPLCPGPPSTQDARPQDAAEAGRPPALHNLPTCRPGKLLSPLRAAQRSPPKKPS